MNGPCSATARAIPDDKVLVPGVVDTTTNFVEHPELVGQRIGRFVDIVGAERVIAGSDCGFGTFAGFGAVDPEIAYAKLAALAKGRRWPDDAACAYSRHDVRCAPVRAADRGGFRARGPCSYRRLHGA